MDNYHLSVPGKTFLVGEYLVLQGGPAIVLNTAPRFELIAMQRTAFPPTSQLQYKTLTTGIDLKGPAGKFLQHYARFFDPYQLNFIDNYGGIGGFGASSAQFLMLAYLQKRLEGKTLELTDLLKDYKEFAWDGKGISPSGVDLIAQWYGGVCYFHKINNQLMTFSWPFDDIDYALIHTGNKLATHQHLKELVKLHIDHFEQIVEQARFALENKDSLQFLEAIANYANALDENNLISKPTKELLKKISICSKIIAKKGCGALGADVIVIFFERSNTKIIIEWLKQKKFNVIAYGHQVEPGLREVKE